MGRTVVGRRDAARTLRAYKGLLTAPRRQCRANIPHYGSRLIHWTLCRAVRARTRGAIAAESGSSAACPATDLAKGRVSVRSAVGAEAVPVAASRSVCKERARTPPGVAPAPRRVSAARSPLARLRSRHYFVFELSLLASGRSTTGRSSVPAARWPRPPRRQPLPDHSSPDPLPSMFAQALHLVAQFLPAWTMGRIAAPEWRRPRERRRPDPFIRRIPQVSDRWLADHRRTSGKDGDRP